VIFSFLFKSSRHHVLLFPFSFTLFSNPVYYNKQLSSSPYKTLHTIHHLQRFQLHKNLETAIILVRNLLQPLVNKPVPQYQYQTIQALPQFIHLPTSSAPQFVPSPTRPPQVHKLSNPRPPQFQTHFTKLLPQYTNKSLHNNTTPSKLHHPVHQAKPPCYHNSSHLNHASTNKTIPSNHLHGGHPHQPVQCLSPQFVVQRSHLSPCKFNVPT